MLAAANDLRRLALSFPFPTQFAGLYASVSVSVEATTLQYATPTPSQGRRETNSCPHRFKGAEGSNHATEQLLVRQKDTCGGISACWHHCQGSDSDLGSRRPLVQQAASLVVAGDTLRGNHHGLTFQRRRAPQQEALVDRRRHGAGDVAVIEAW